ncbi:ABATE domain-containing protein [Nocardia sp. NBC_01503]|uniref:CGNR zinc finger domain-containing protein n=1 Tax=Nocardia sp. NBC_01503 TaxID=2975997 RepID=UPI002E7B98D2|nr:ABATE domain-containing protein [Nocardia sp. NBC_01503]WTL34846.1 ABATE domain-containing protein [Nocardia sp. NBC_01503]
MFTFVSGNLALDFIGTVKSRRDRFEDTLETPADLDAWAIEANLLDTAPHTDATELERSTRLREATWRMALAVIAGETIAAADRRLVNEIALGALPGVELTADGDVQRSGTGESVLAAIARSAIELIGGADRNRVRECGREDCTRLYVDTSRAGSRRWCDMTICGNRAKSAAFRARNTESDAAH